MATSAEMLCRYTPPAFRQFTEGVVNQKFDEEPKYEAYMKLFEPLCGPAPQRPILTEGASKVRVLQNILSEKCKMSMCWHLMLLSSLVFIMDSGQYGNPSWLLHCLVCHYG
jgi:hypothetical protein